MLMLRFSCAKAAREHGTQRESGTQREQHPKQSNLGPTAFYVVGLAGVLASRSQPNRSVMVGMVPSCTASLKRT